MILLLLIVLIILIAILAPKPQPKKPKSVRLPFSDRPVPLADIKGVSLQDGLLTVRLGRGAVTVAPETLDESERAALMAIAFRKAG